VLGLHMRLSIYIPTTVKVTNFLSKSEGRRNLRNVNRYVTNFTVPDFHPPRWSNCIQWEAGMYLPNYLTSLRPCRRQQVSKEGRQLCQYPPVVHRDGFGGSTTPFLRNSECPPKSCQSQPGCKNCQKLMNLGHLHPKKFGKMAVNF